MYPCRFARTNAGWDDSHTDSNERLLVLRYLVLGVRGLRSGRTRFENHIVEAPEN